MMMSPALASGAPTLKVSSAYVGAGMMIHTHTKKSAAAAARASHERRRAVRALVMADATALVRADQWRAR